ncbi:hypothetical protein [Chryseobacterium sp. 22458]|uniref:hypothetical protein n=1 Tax=Chryseobacterium sp. 22458 TaxID=3453921 RepID=UPI003F851E90
MTADITFENEFEKAITSDEAAINLHFHKVFTVNAEVFRKEEYKNNILISVIHYLKADDNEQLILSELVNHYPDLDWFEIRIIEQIGVYRKEIQRFLLSTGAYEDFQITLLRNEDGLPIFEREDEIVDERSHSGTRKYYYDPLSKQEKFEFIYKPDGHLSSMRGSEPPFVAENDYSIKYCEIEFFFPGFLSENPYYQNADLLP